MSFRLTMLPMLVVMLIFYLITEWKNPRYWLLSWGIGILTIGLINLPFYIISTGRMYYDCYGLHQIFSPFSIAHFYIMKLEFIWLTSQNIFFFCLLLLITFFYFISHHPLETIRRHKYYFAVVCGLFLTTCAHLSANYSQDAYSTSIYPLGIALLAPAFIRFYREYYKDFGHTARIVVIILGIFWFLRYGTRSIRFIEGKPIVLYLNGIGKDIRRVTNGQGYMLSHDTPTLALLSDLPLLNGCENCEYFPFYTSLECSYYKVLNDSIIKDQIVNRKPSVIIISDQSFNVYFPPKSEIKGRHEYYKSLLDKHYRLYKTIPFQYLPKTSHSYIYIR